MDKKEELFNYSFSLIANAGNAKSMALDAINMAKEGQIENAQQMLNSARSELTKIHHAHTEIIQKEANGSEYQMTILATHAQDHLTSALIILDLAEHIIELYSRAKN